MTQIKLRFMTLQGKNKISIFIICFLYFSIVGYSQTDSLYHIIQEKGLAFVKPIKDGHIEGLKDIKPPKNTWTYSKLQEYKTELEDNRNFTYGSFIQPSASPNKFGFNYYALQFNGGEHHYAFVAVIQYEIINGAIIKSGLNYLITEKEGLKKWWNSAASHCLNNNTFLNINPMKIDCPPPPFKE